MFLERIVTCFIDDAVGLENRHHLNLDTHHVGVRLPALRLDVAAPRRSCSRKSLAGIPDDEVDKITHLNAMRVFQYDPFAVRPKAAVHGRRAAGPGGATST